MLLPAVEVTLITIIQTVRIENVIQHRRRRGARKRHEATESVVYFSALLPHEHLSVKLGVRLSAARDILQRTVHHHEAGVELPHAFVLSALLQHL